MRIIGNQCTRILMNHSIAGSFKSSACEFKLSPYFW